MSEPDNLGIEMLVTGHLVRQCGILARLLVSRDKAGNVRNVHKARVVCRRICEVLKVSDVVIPVKKLRKRRKKIRRLASLLGPLRDADVRVEHVRKFIKNIPADKQASVCPGAERILLRLKHDRKELKSKAAAGLKQFVHSNVMAGFILVYADMKQPPALTLEPAVALCLWDGCCRQLGRRAAKMLACENFLSDPSDVKALHEFRIACKKLRYAVEIYQGIFPHRLQPALSALKKFQSLLGLIHDCDQWNEYVDSFVKTEKQLIIDRRGNADEFLMLKPGLDNFRRHIRLERKVLFERFKDMWIKSGEKGAWEKFITVIELQSESVK